MRSTQPISVAHVVLSLNPGGTERLVIELARRLDARFPSRVCCIDEPGAWASELTSHGIDVSALHRRPGFRPSLGLRLAALARARGTTLLHCHHFSPFVYGRIAALAKPGLRLVFTEHGRLSDAQPSAKRRRVNAWLSRGVGNLFAVSEDLRRHLLKEGFPSRMAVIHNGIDAQAAPTEEQRVRARAALGVSHEDTVIGTVARLDPVKDLATLTAAFAAVRHAFPRARLVIVGDGPERDALQRAAAPLGSAVVWLGQRNDVRALLPGIDVYTNSSISEGISLTLLEAMAAELPVVATAVGGTPEVVVPERTGILCAPRSPAALADALTRVIIDAPMARALGRAGRERVLEHFTIERMVERYASIYEQGH